MLRRAQFAQFVSSTTSLTMNRYFRLMSLATLEFIFNLPISTYGLYLNITSRPIYPWKSWSDIHFDWFTIDTFPSILWRSNPTLSVTLELSRWSVVFCAFIFFGFFGFADEARKHYRLAYWAIAKRFGVTPPPFSLGGKVHPGLAPLFFLTFHAVYLRCTPSVLANHLVARSLSTNPYQASSPAPWS